MHRAVEDTDLLKRRVIARALGIPVPATITAAEQLLRTRLDPEVYNAVLHLAQLLSEGGPALTRTIADHVGYGTVAALFPETLSFIRAYEEEQGDTAQSAAVFRELLVVAAAFHERLMNQVFGAMYAENTRLHLQQRVESIGAGQPSQELLEREHAELIREAQHHAADVDGLTAVHTTTTTPVLATTAEGVDYAIPLLLSVHNPIRRQCRVHIGPLRQLERFIVERQMTIPWERVGDGILLECVLPDALGGTHPPHRLYLPHADLVAMNARGSALHTSIGRKAPLRLYPEFFPSPHPQQAHDLPDEPIASIRALNHSIEIRREHLGTRLTVFA